MSSLVTVNVGGVKYTTTLATLTTYPASMLGAMFSGTMPSTLDHEGCYFIDRDGKLFGYILNFLRSMKLTLPEGFRDWESLKVEADFYQIQALSEELEKRMSSGKPMLRKFIVEIIEVRTGSAATLPTNNSRVKTVVSGQKSVITSLPVVLNGQAEKLGTRGDKEFVELELCGRNSRIRLTQFLADSGWELLDSGMSSSSAYDNKAIVSTTLLEQTYKERWIWQGESYPQITPEEQESLMNGYPE